MTAGRFDGRRVLVTGGAGRIGSATARRLATEGARLILADRPGPALEAVLREVQAVGAAAISVGYDAALADDSLRLVEAAAAAWAGLDVVCNIGAIYSKSHTETVTDDDWAQVLQVNLGSVFTICRTAIPHLRASGGNVCSIASLAALEGQAYATAYAVSKAGIVALTKSMAAEYASAGIRFNCICSGGVRSGMSVMPAPEGFDPDLSFRRSKLKGLVDGFGEPEDIASAVAYLTSSEARYVSGSAFVVDGAQNLI